MASNDIGVKVSQIGWDVKTAGDANLYLSSSWPILKIEKTDTANGGAVINHDLTYPPLAFAWTPSGGLSICTVNSRSITLPASATNPVRYFIFRLPLNVAYQSPVIHSPLTDPGGADHDFGLKFVKDGKKITSKDYRDFTLHSSVRSPLLHAVIYAPLAPIASQFTFGLKWIPDLPYRPVYFAFYSSDNDTFVPLSAISQISPKINNDSDNGIVINAVGKTGYGSIILLKDPLDFPNRTVVNL